MHSRTIIGLKSRRQFAASGAALLASLFSLKPAHAAIQSDLQWEFGPLRYLQHACAHHARIDDTHAVAQSDLAEKRACDFRHGRVCVVDGWLLSKTEARFYASLAKQ